MPEGSDSVLPELADVAVAMAQRRDAPHVLRVLCRRLAEQLDCVGVGASLVSGDHVYFTTAAPDGLDALQAIERNRPDPSSVQAIRAGRPVHLSELARAGADRRFAAVAAAAGVDAAVVLPFGVPTAVGALALYSGEKHDWAPEDLRHATLLSTLAASFIAASADADRHRRAYRRLEWTCRQRAVVEQAKGMIAAERAVGVEAAFAMLRKYANDHNATLAEVADAVITLGLRV